MSSLLSKRYKVDYSHNHNPNDYERVKAATFGTDADETSHASRFCRFLGVIGYYIAYASNLQLSIDVITIIEQYFAAPPVTVMPKHIVEAILLEPESKKRELPQLDETWVDIYPKGADVKQLFNLQQAVLSHDEYIHFGAPSGDIKVVHAGFLGSTVLYRALHPIGMGVCTHQTKTEDDEIPLTSVKWLSSATSVSCNYRHMHGYYSTTINDPYCSFYWFTALRYVEAMIIQLRCGALAIGDLHITYTNYDEYMKHLETPLTQGDFITSITHLMTSIQFQRLMFKYSCRLTDIHLKKMFQLYTGAIQPTPSGEIIDSKALMSIEVFAQAVLAILLPGQPEDQGDLAFSIDAIYYVLSDPHANWASVFYGAVPRTAGANYLREPIIEGKVTPPVEKDPWTNRGAAILRLNETRVRGHIERNVKGKPKHVPFEPVHYYGLELVVSFVRADRRDQHELAWKPGEDGYLTMDRTTLENKILEWSTEEYPDLVITPYKRWPVKPIPHATETGHRRFVPTALPSPQSNINNNN